jgi:hypothetical protein
MRPICHEFNVEERTVVNTPLSKGVHVVELMLEGESELHYDNVPYDSNLQLNSHGLVNDAIQSGTVLFIKHCGVRAASALEQASDWSAKYRAKMLNRNERMFSVAW